MRILQVCPRYFPYYGGIEEHVKHISEGLAKENHVVVCTTDPSGTHEKSEIINNVEVNRFKSFAPNEAYYFSREMKKYLKKNSKQFDIVHAHSYHAFPALYASNVAESNNLVFSPHYHGKGHSFFRNLLHTPYTRFGKKIFEKANKIVCVSNFERTIVENNFGIRKNKILVIPNGVNLREFREFEKRKNAKNLLFVGRIEKYKGIHYLIETLPKLEDNVILNVVGQGPYTKYLLKLVSKLGLMERVNFFQDLSRRQLLEKYANAGVFVLLSTYEAFGICVAEALASGTPCVLAKTSALVEWVDGVNCFGVSYPIKINELVDVITNVIGKPIGAVNLSDWDDVVQKITALYTAIL